MQMMQAIAMPCTKSSDRMTGRASRPSRSIVKLAVLSLVAFMTCLEGMASAGSVSYPLNLNAGWSLAGNSLTVPMSVRDVFAAKSDVVSVWKWSAGSARWEFYSPELDASGSLAEYCASKGYGVLATINPGEGFWVNAKGAVELGTMSGPGFSLGASNLVYGWNLVATADDYAPSALASGIGNATSLWSWDSAANAWMFYAPTLAASNTLSNYIQEQGYKDFGALTLGKGRGFWINYAGGLGAFTGNIVLGSPNTTSIKANVYSADQGGSVYAAYGTSPGAYDKCTPVSTLVAGTPLELTLDGLSENTRYYYRLFYQSPSGTGSGPTSEYSFHTPRPIGSTFTFTIQADSHLDENSSLDQYRNTLANVLADQGDFHMDLGDTFMTEKYTQPLNATVGMASDQPTVVSRYGYERAHFGRFAHSVPLFLVNGNHDAELGWLANGTAQSLPIWATKARQAYFANPKPAGIYSGDTLVEPFVGERASWYAWRWGDALFVALDPYWSSKTQASKDAWNLTLGERQYRWLAATLAASAAKYKFVFIHNLVGGLDGQMRGGIEAAPYFEWGGKNLDGSDGFAFHRPGWDMPIHQLLVANKVTAVFHGHDHLYAKQTMDGIVYQEVPQPSALNNFNGPLLSLVYHYASGTILSSSGHLRVTVSPAGVTSEYVRSWLPANENASRKNRQVDDRWTAGAR